MNGRVVVPSRRLVLKSASSAREALEGVGWSMVCAGTSRKSVVAFSIQWSRLKCSSFVLRS